MSSKKRILFLYTELAGYFLACVEQLLTEEVEVHIVRWPVNKEAPFQFEFTDQLNIYSKEGYTLETLQQLVANINPDVIYSSGWVDKDYLKICKQYKGKVSTIVGFDNQWEGGLKQQMATLLSPLLVRKYFSHAWVPGAPQVPFAKKLGYEGKHLLTGFYSADVDLFQQHYEQYKAEKEVRFPHRFIYVGRYVAFKGIKDLWQAFMALDHDANDWELWCIGTGELEQEAPQHPKIKHLGFVQPEDLGPYIKDTGVFVLPSHFEPWGVVVHEYAAAGFPLICSDKVGAETKFLAPGENGYRYAAGNVEALKAAMTNIMQQSDEALVTMGQKSVAIAKTLTPQTWVNTLMQV